MLLPFLCLFPHFDHSGHITDNQTHYYLAVRESVKLLVKNLKRNRSLRMPKGRARSNNIMNPEAKGCGVVNWIEGPSVLSVQIGHRFK